MAYFIFTKNLNNEENTLYRIAENLSDLNNLNIDQSNYKIIEVTQNNFNDVKFGLKFPKSYNENSITFIDVDSSLLNKKVTEKILTNLKEKINEFLKENKNHILYSVWNNYYIELNSFDSETITYPLNKSLEKHLSDLGKNSYSIFQLP